jgi:hypothetical protein
MILKIDKIPDILFNKLKKIIKNKSLNNNNKLAGNLSEQYKILEAIPIFEEYLLKLISQDKILMEDMNERYKMLSKDVPIKLTDMWVNYQKKHEFNPLHNHTGCFSFIIFVDIPYTMEEQFKYSKVKETNSFRAGHLEFLTTNHFGNLETKIFAVDKTFNQSAFIFPAVLRHTVYPFYKVNKPRITVSGNFKFVIK